MGALFECRGAMRVIMSPHFRMVLQRGAVFDSEKNVGVYWGLRV